ncbi:MAG TPA: ATP-binding protein, partial [Gammaproteobacteria bacterium]|nr:ATP-binding protein [Gammaproteobacteria bacterium]
GVMKILRDDQKRNLPTEGDFTTLTDSLDIATCLLLFDLHWQYIFRKKLSIDHRTWAKELIGFRNRLAHIGGKDFSSDDTWRALDTMSRLCEQLDSESTEEIRGLLRASRYGSTFGSTVLTEASNSVVTPGKNKKGGILKQTPMSGLPSWRDVIEPHPDVAQGRYKNAEFAADLAQVARGEGAYEYRDPVEFFARTYVTEGMRGLLAQAIRRVSGQDGEPVIQLKTAFGGGKTHSMLALYHMMRGRVSLDKIPNIKPVLQEAGVNSLPKTNVAVLVGTALDPTKSKRPNNMPGITINTFWGEMAAQLAESAGDLTLYDLVKESDKKGVSPGSETLKNLFDAAAPCLILMDELVAYAKKIYGANGLPAGTFDNFISFIQELTEAARASKNSLVVASIPESEIEIGGEAGKIALETIEHTFGRMESIWKPVAANEGFEVVRRRLFLDCKNPNSRDAVCAAFSAMYNENENDFPIESRELEYKERMESCYPIHPEVFDRLYKDWSTLERFQRTRGVLRLMAAVVYELWMGNDASLMIMPGSIPMDVPNVRDELTRHLSDNWNGIVDKEVDGKSSTPYKVDKNARYGRHLASRRVARTIMLGSAPTGREQVVRGIESSRIRLGVVQPGENIAVFNDALNTLRNSLSFLYTNPSGDRFWYDSRPTLRKTADDRATQVSASDVEYEIESRLRALRREQPFGGIHISPSSSLDVPDEQSVRLVILRPSDDYKASNPENNAMKAVAEILDNRGNTPRIYRNMLAFVAPDQELMGNLKLAVRQYIAWKSIKEDSEDLNLDAAQNRETLNNLLRANETVESRVRETYCWLLVPYIDKNMDIKSIIWDTIRISGGNESIISKAAKKMLQNEQVITIWSPMLLKMELDNLLWKDRDFIEIKKLWEYICTYCYLPRLANEDVLMDVIQKGVNSTEYFAFSSGFDGIRFIDLKYNQYIGTVEKSGVLIKTAAAIEQLNSDSAKNDGERDGWTKSQGGKATEGGAQSGNTYSPRMRDNDYGSGVVGEGSDRDSVDTTKPKNRRFYMSADLDTTRINRDVNRYVEEIIQHLISVDGASVTISLEVQAESKNGFSQQVVRTISEICQTLKVSDAGFEE